MHKKKVVLIILSNYNIGGAQRIIIDYANKLVKKYHVILLTIQKSNIKNFSSEIDISIKKIELNSNGRKSILTIRKKIKNIEPDYIFSTQAYINVITCISSMFIKKNSKLILREANAIPLKTNKLYWASKLTYWYADMIICQTNTIKNNMLNEYNINENNITVIPNHFDLNKIEKKASENVNFKKREIFTFIYCGRLERVKGVRKIIDNFLVVQKKVNHIELIIVGQGSEESYIKMITSKYNSVKYLGPKTNPYPYLNMADCILFSSIKEGFPNTMVEGMLLNTIVLTNDFRGGAATDILNNELSEYIYDDDISFQNKMFEIAYYTESNIENVKAKFKRRAMIFTREFMVDEIFQ